MSWFLPTHLAAPGLNAQVELAKRSLSEHQCAVIRIADVPSACSTAIDETAFEQLCSPLLQRVSQLKIHPRERIEFRTLSARLVLVSRTAGQRA